jgi:hypothetical protein
VRRIQENTAINTKNKSHAVTAEIEVPQAGATGVIVAQGGSMAGWSLYAHEGRLKYHYNYMAVRQYAVADSSSLPAGRHQVRMEFTYDGGGLGKGATVTLFVDGKQVGQGRIDRTILRTKRDRAILAGHEEQRSADDRRRLPDDLRAGRCPPGGAAGQLAAGRARLLALHPRVLAAGSGH